MSFSIEIIFGQLNIYLATFYWSRCWKPRRVGWVNESLPKKWSWQLSWVVVVELLKETTYFSFDLSFVQENGLLDNKILVSHWPNDAQQYMLSTLTNQWSSLQVFLWQYNLTSAYYFSGLSYKCCMILIYNFRNVLNAKKSLWYLS